MSSFETMFKGILHTAVLIGGLVGSVAAAGESATFDVYLKGIKAGTLSYAANMSGQSYSASAKVRATGMVKRLSDFRFDASSTGTRSGARYRPARYDEKSNTGKRKANKSLTYRGGVPAVSRSDGKSKDYWLKPAAQKGALDPMTGMYLLMRDVPSAELCKLNVDLFDGARRVNISTRANGSKACKGTYTRKGGFSRKELKEGKTFPFSLSYAPDGSMMRLEKMEFATVRGRAKLVRR